MNCKHRIFVSLIAWAVCFASVVEAAPSPTPRPGAAKAAPKSQPVKKPGKKKSSTPPPKKKASAQPTQKSAAKPAREDAQPSAKAPNLDSLAQLQGANAKEPTFIKSDSLTLNAEDRVFTYSGNVEVKQGLMTLTCAEIVGRYNDKNQIDTIDARKDVVIVKEDIRGTANKALFDAKTNTITLSENPAVEQSGSILSADTIKIFLNENRSVADGTVRVKLVERSERKEPITFR